MERVEKRCIAIVFPGVEHDRTLELSGLISLRDRRQEVCRKLFRSLKLNDSHKLHKLHPPLNEPKYNLRQKRTYILVIIQLYLGRFPLVRSERLDL